MVKFILSLVICFHGATTYAQVLGFALAEGQKKVQIPIQIHNNLIVVPVVLNDALPLRFVVDTGVRTAILTQKSFSDILQLPYSRKYSISGPGGEKMIDAYVTNNVSLRLPGLNGKGHALLVLEEDYLELRNYLGVDVHGILGYELFSRFIVQIDYSKKIMTLYAPDRFHPRKRFQSLPIRVEDTKPYVVAPLVMADNTTLSAKLLIDTGASHGLMLDTQSDDRIVAPTKTVSSTIGRGLGGAISGKVGRIQSLQLGNISIPNVLANFPDANSYMDTLKSTAVFRNGSIGGEVLTRFTVVFDYPREQIFVRKNGDFKKPFYFNLSGITVRAIGGKLDVFEIIEVQSQSSGERAGIQLGDRIVAINNYDTKLLHLNNINAMLNSKPGKKVRLELLRNGQRIQKTILLRDAI
jgi:hypothetical protein